MDSQNPSRNEIKSTKIVRLVDNILNTLDSLIVTTYIQSEFILIDGYIETTTKQMLDIHTNYYPNGSSIRENGCIQIIASEEVKVHNAIGILQRLIYDITGIPVVMQNFNGTLLRYTDLSQDSMQDIKRMISLAERTVRNEMSLMTKKCFDVPLEIRYI